MSQTAFGGTGRVHTGLSRRWNLRAVSSSLRPMEPGLAKKAVNFSAFLDAARPDYHVGTS